MEACWLGYNVLEIHPNSVRISLVAVYSTSSQVSCCIMGTATIYRCWLLSKPVVYLENLVQVNTWMAAAAILTSAWECKAVAVAAAAAAPLETPAAAPATAAPAASMAAAAATAVAAAAAAA